MSFAPLLARLSDVFPLGHSIPLANRNLFIDGRFDNWNAVSGSATGTYGPATMWINAAGLSGAATFQHFTMVGVDNFPVDSSPLLCWQHQQTTASTGTIAARNGPFICQRIEGVNTLSNHSATLSAKLWTSSGSATIPGIILSQEFGTGGSPSAAVILDKTVNWVITPTPKVFSVRLDFPSINGKTLGTSGNDDILIGLWFPVGSTFGIIGTEFQLERSSPNSSSDINGNGGVPTAFEYRGPQAETARVARYYQFYSSLLVSGYNVSGSGIFLEFPYNTAMRGVPAISFANQIYSGTSSLAVNVAGSNHSRLQAVTTATAFGTVVVDTMLDARL